MSKRKLISIIIMCVCVIAIVALIVVYTVYTSKQIFDESANHFTELYKQVNKTYSSVVNKNWGFLHSCLPYIEERSEGDSRDVQEIVEFLNAQKENWKFTSFYMIDEDGYAVTDSGVKRSFGVDSSYIAALLNDEDIIVEGERRDFDENGQLGDPMYQVTLFAVPINYRAISADGNGYVNYIGLAITYNVDAMSEVLKVGAFSGHGNCRIITSDGRVLMADNNKQDTQYLKHLLEYASFTRSSKEQVEQDFKNKVQGVATFKYDNNEYYIVYMPVEFNDWMMVGIVSADVLNKSMNEYISVTTAIMAGVAIVLVAAIIGIVVVFNIAKNKENELKLKSRDELFNLLTKDTNDVFILFSPVDFTSAYVSRNIERVLGIDPESIHKDIRNLLTASTQTDTELNLDDLNSVSVNEARETDIEFRNSQTGDTLWFKLSLHRASLNGIDNFIMMLSDRTKEQAMNANLEQALHIAKSANAAKSNFLANMSHDIRTPMNAILGFTTLLSRNAENPETVREYVGKISTSGQHLLSIINDILDMSKIESGKTSLNIEEFSLPELLETLYAIILPQSSAKKQHFDIHTKGNLPAMVLGDRLRLNQILLNLLVNAVKYTPNGGNIELLIEEIDRKLHKHVHVRFVVKDNGFGMSEEFVDCIFAPFAREVTEATKDIQGTGLGMAITKNLVDLMGGTIHIDSKLGEGSAFTVELELAIADETSEEDVWSSYNIKRILIVDDDEDICLNVIESMKDIGVDTAYALDGYTAVDMLSQADEKYDLVLLDWKMPALSGLDTAKLMREKFGEDINIIVLTAYDIGDIESDANGAGITAFVQKPFFMSNFRRAVEKLYNKDYIDGSEAASDESSDSVSLHGLKVLAAEDNEINAEILSELLDVEGATCHIECNGQEIVKHFENSEVGDYDIIFMDVQMPIMNGYEATRAIRACNHPLAKTIPIIAMTANAFDDDVKMALDSGMNAHVAKPVDMNKLKATIKQLRQEQFKSND